MSLAFVVGMWHGASQYLTDVTLTNKCCLLVLHYIGACSSLAFVVGIWHDTLQYLANVMLASQCCLHVLHNYGV